MERSEIFEHIETLREDAYFRNVGNNKSELAFRESVADWISENFEEKSSLDVEDIKVIVAQTIVDTIEGFDSNKSSQEMLNEQADKAIDEIDKELLKKPRQ